MNNFRDKRLYKLNLIFFKYKFSGLLTTFVTWEMTKGSYKSFNIFAFLIARFLRLTPGLLAVILLTFLLPLFGSGPGNVPFQWLHKIFILQICMLIGFHEIVDPVVEGCQKNWWTNLVYLNNYIDTDHIVS